jgi:hypothetical protein
VGGRRAKATGSGGRDHGDPIALPLLDHPRARRPADAEGADEIRRRGTPKQTERTGGGHGSKIGGWKKNYNI